MSMLINSVNAPTTDSAISLFELTLGAKLPASYRQFLIRTNGGRPAQTSFQLMGYPSTEAWSVGAFFGIGTLHPTNELSYAFDLYGAAIPAGLVLIAGDDMGNYVCLDLRRGGDQVAFWDKRHFWGTGEWREKDLYHVADTFGSFIASLQPSDERIRRISP
jgi:SMI1 / KNR4 family (SUKH-1)